MQITSVPLRISFLGGGTDFPEFYMKHGGGVISTTIDKYIHIITNDRFDDEIRVSYSETEIVESVNDIKHNMIREALKKYGITSNVELVTISDIPGRGTGLGSSSALAVGLSKSLGNHETSVLPAEAFALESVSLGSPVGVQDHYSAAYGGFNYYRFDKYGAQTFEMDCEDFLEGVMLFYTGISRDANSILERQKNNIGNVTQTLLRMNKLTENAFSKRSKDFMIRAIRESWEMKKTLADGITNDEIDDMYSAAIDSGALCGKISGAGGGGFLMLYAPEDKKNDVRDALRYYKELKFKPVGTGVRTYVL